MKLWPLLPKVIVLAVMPPLIPLSWNVKKCKQWIHFACSKLPPGMLIQFRKSSKAYSCSTCVHERFTIDFTGLHDTYEEVIIKQNITLRTGVTADFSSQTDHPPPPPTEEPDPTHTDSLPHPAFG